LRGSKADEALAAAEAALPNQTKNILQRAKEAMSGLVEIGRLDSTDKGYALV
jgi:hypothetical protein